MDERIRIIAIDDEEPMLRILRKTLEPEGFRVETYQRPDEALGDIRKGGADLVITDLMMPGLDGYRVLEETLSADPGIMVIVITAFSSIESAVKAMKAGAYDFIPKPFDPEHLLIVVKKAIQKRALERENLNLRQQLDSRDYLSEIVGVSGPIRELKALIEKVKDTDANLLIIGESGVGKELVARAVHYGSRRKAASFVPINCGALPDNLLESELFGYERGAFTGALSRKKGLLEMAAGGTVFLDEVESISPMMQVKILRFLQDRSFIRLGGENLIEVDVRVIAATNEDLAAAVDEGRFRKDLYYRLKVIPIHVPPLRSRKDDIPLLIRHFIRKYSAKTGKTIEGITGEAEKILSRYHWEGNVRELENIIERAITLTDDNMIKREEIPEEIITPESRPSPAESPYPVELPLSELEHLHIRKVLKETNGNKSRAARLLGIDYSTLLRKLKVMDCI